MSEVLHRKISCNLPNSKFNNVYTNALQEHPSTDRRLSMISSVTAQSSIMPTQFLRFEEPHSTEMSESDDCEGGSPDMERGLTKSTNGGDCTLTISGLHMNKQCSLSKRDLVDQSFYDNQSCKSGYKDLLHQKLTDATWDHY